MNKITALNVFRRVVELGTFRAAADDLQLSQAAVSKNVNELEDYLGLALINRTTRRMSVTDAGMAYYSQICSVLDDLDAADQSVMASSFTLKGRLRISVPMSFGLTRINPLICDFKQQYPEISIEVMLSDAYIDLIDSAVDVAIRGGNALSDSSMRSKPVCQVRRVLCASRAYLSAAPPLDHPDDLKSHDCLVYSLSSSPRKWFFGNNSENVAVEISPGSYSVNNGIALRQAAVKGLGIILVPEEYVQAEIAEGTLVEILPEWKPDTHALFAVYPYHKEQSQKVRLFIDFIAAALGSV